MNEANKNEELEQIQSMLKQHREEKMQAMKSLANKLKSYTFLSNYEILLKDTTSMTKQQLHIHEHMYFILKAKYNNFNFK